MKVLGSSLPTGFVWEEISSFDVVVEGWNSTLPGWVSGWLTWTDSYLTTDCLSRQHLGFEPEWWMSRSRSR